ncbi:PIG-L family deacetylase [Deinococcus peraridilitoris]|uniref:Putative LmbE-like protein n=1 Tax=Deinococcus peraridilitoris (strain DSM 19664 / LMG 22246 / CIP 109416 / KR-200) TaxID=937777 RepID=K9ZXS2_DEIPD|nr:PIG-L family deacetylase [Deinococcus peraridilitoris]AFZ66463.1 putative LmbE-like protein [Deinococcus peraridilitoris DSM 19664]
MITTFGTPQPLHALCLAPHPDDAEIGAGGTLAQLARLGRPVGILELSRGEQGTLGTPEIRALECVRAGEILGLSWRGQLGLPDGDLGDTPEAAHALAAVLRLVRPQLLFVPHYADRHPDHVGSYQLAKRALHLAALAKAEVPGSSHRAARVLLYQGNAPIQPNVLVDIEQDLITWEAAIRAHASQFSGRAVSETVTPEVIERRKARLMYWGTFAGRRFCEAFESESPLLLAPQSL